MSNINSIVTLIDSADEIIGLVEKSIPHINKLGSLISPILKNWTIALVDLTDLGIKRYEELGYTREEAIKLTMYNKLSLLELGKNKQ